MIQQSNPLMRGSGTDGSLNPSLRPDGHGLEALAAWGAMMDECRRESLGFMVKRMETDGEAFRQALTCPSLQDLLALHVQWVDESWRAYSAELTKMLAICTMHEANAAQRGTNKHGVLRDSSHMH